jgi:hypothetical protein
MGLVFQASTKRRCRRAAVHQVATACPDPGLPRHVVPLDDPGATDPAVAGRKAANLARARRLGFSALPGFVVTTSGCSALGLSVAERLPPLLSTPLYRAWSELSAGGARPVVVRSSSPGEDGGTSSMAGQFTSVLGVKTWEQFLSALRRWCRKNGIADFRVVAERGAGSHVKVYANGRETIVKDGELSPVYVQVVLKQLGLPKDAI